MLKDLIRIAEHRGFFSLVELKDEILKFNLKQAGICMKLNIVNEWIRSIYSKSEESSIMYVSNETGADLKPLNIFTFNKSVPIGLIEVAKNSCYNKMTCKFERYFHPNESTQLKLCIVVAQSDAMQFFLQWQRYRKIWWSSITTSPGLFNLKDITYKKKSAEVEVLANFPWGQQSVESISIEENLSQGADDIKRAKFESVLTVESALLTLLTDGYSNRTKEDYLRLHRTMAPYKVSFVIDCSNPEKKATLHELAELLNYKLNNNGISTWLPEDSTASIENQLVERYRLGVPYTAVLTEEALHSGILLLQHSSTTLQEQIHISDFGEYVSKLLKSCFIT